MIKYPRSNRIEIGCDICGNDLDTEEERETGLCDICYQKDMQRQVNEQQHPDDPA